MFNKPLSYRFIQRNSNKYGTYSYAYEYIYKFFYQDLKKKNRRKYIVQIKQYSSTHFQVDFYSPISSKDKDFRNLDISKYRYTTKAGGANIVAATIFAILGSLRQKFPDMSFGLQAASLIGEESDNNNRRFQVYQKILASVTEASQNFWEAFAYTEESYIFVIQSRFSAQRSQIINEYGRIFGKVFTGSEESTDPCWRETNSAGY